MLFVIFLAEYYQDVLHLLVMPITSWLILRTSYYSIKKIYDSSEGELWQNQRKKGICSDKIAEG
jgi:hypothetical protein